MTSGSKQKKSSLDRSAKSLFITFVVLTVIYFFGKTVMPILFAGLASVILLPIVSFLEDKGIPKGLSAFITVLSLSIVVIAVVFVIVIQSQEIIKDLTPMIEDEEYLDVNDLPLISDAFQSYINNHMQTIRENLTELKGTLLSLVRDSFVGFKNTLLFLITCPIYIFFMLLYRDNVFKFIEAYQQKDNNRSRGRVIIKKVRKSLYMYLRGLIFISLIIGVLTYVGLLLLGIDHALFFGIIAAVLAPIPYIGVVISALFPVVFALITKDSGWYALGVIGIFAVVQFLEGNFITPRVMGSSVNVNPLIILLSLVILGTLAGILGVILTVPLLATIKVIVEFYPHLKPWTYLLEDRKPE
ncbi:MAG: AI-2E family transporter [Brumimicrobium sp.]|nr:AI-2E family transporter [Brumimicrobium sp.]